MGQEINGANQKYKNNLKNKKLTALEILLY